MFQISGEVDCCYGQAGEDQATQYLIVQVCWELTLETHQTFDVDGRRMVTSEPSNISSKPH